MPKTKTLECHLTLIKWWLENVQRKKHLANIYKDLVSKVQAHKDYQDKTYNEIVHIALNMCLDGLLPEDNEFLPTKLDPRSGMEVIPEAESPLDEMTQIIMALLHHINKRKEIQNTAHLDTESDEEFIKRARKAFKLDPPPPNPSTLEKPKFQRLYSSSEDTDQQMNVDNSSEEEDPISPFHFYPSLECHLL